MAPPPAVEEERCDLIVVGAGLAAAHFVSRLPDKLLKGTRVVDAGGTWLGGWSQRCAALGAPHVRTPVMQHPHAEPLALQAFADKRGRQQELTPVTKGFAPVPSLPLFLDFCAAKVVGALPQALRQPQRDAVLHLEPAEDGKGCRVHLAGGRVLAARAVIYTPANRQPVLPAWARHLLIEGDEAAAAAAGGAGVAAAGGPATEQAAERAQQAQRLPPGWATADQVDLRGAELADLSGRSVVVVGGGMSAGLLAAGAAERGADVVLVCHRPLVPLPFETEVGWWGAKRLNEFRQLDSGAARLRACHRARMQGSVHLPVWRRLTQQATTGKLTVLEGWEVAAAEQQEPAAPAEGSSGDGSSGSGSWQLALKQRKQAEAPTLFQQAVAATLAAAAGSVGAPAEAQPAGEAPQQTQQERRVHAQYVWLACGRAYDAASDPVLAQLLRDRPTPLVGGYPTLDDEYLCWPGAAVYLIGRGALLGVGPCAGDMPGMRLAADRIIKSLQRLDYADAPVWQQAQQRLLQRLRQQLGGAGCDAATAAASAVGDGAAVDGTGTASVTLQLAEAVAAAAAAGPVLALEAEGTLVEEPTRARAIVSKPPNVIDVSDLDPALPRKEVLSYKFIDDDFDISVICQLDEAVPLGQVRTLFGPDFLEMWAVGGGAAYHLHLPSLYGRLQPKKCGFKVNQKAKKVYLLLKKESDAEWRFLKG